MTSLAAALASALADGGWRAKARPSQLPPDGDWLGWLVLAGRGWGKTATGSGWVNDLIETGGAGRIALIAPTAADARDVMVEGQSGILAMAPSWNRPQYEPSKRRITWKNGAVATTFSSEEADRLRGPQHDAVWADELAAWTNPQDIWDMAQFGLRLGSARAGWPRQRRGRSSCSRNCWRANAETSWSRAGRRSKMKRTLRRRSSPRSARDTKAPDSADRN
jgi:phage terminase large subunit-like protein